ncbi:DrmB family protein [Rhodococcus wratislaviensis]|uniref:DrmB family protein n=1 Tax=Rhodococcus wratislaviensis TaxID=44752 RepID=UPI003515D82E
MTTGAKARRGQLLSTYGIGGLFPSETTSFMIVGLDEWHENRTRPVSEPRLARSLRVAELKSPPAGSRDGRDVPVIRFPLTQVCPNPKCRRIGSLYDLAKDWNVAKCAQCKDKPLLTPFRLITACSKGHIDEFPYFRWLHKGAAWGEGTTHEMKMVSLGRTSSLADLVLKCSCGVAPKNLDGTFGPKALAEFGTCSGARPWLGVEAKQDCAETPRVLQRGASNVWFPAVRSAISIPPYSEALAKLVDKHWILLEDLDPVPPKVLEKVAKLSNGKYSTADIAAEIERRRGAEADDDVSEDALRRDEFSALMAGRQDIGIEADFVCLPMPRDPSLPELVTDVRKVTRLREVRALYGFSRLDGVTEPGSEGLCDLSRQRTHWLPAIEVIGEGVFIALDRAKLAEWAAKPFAQGRQQALQTAAGRRAAEFGRPEAPRVDIVEVAVHTLAHVLIDQLSLDAGYPAASLRERLYVDDDMAGILVYTASSDSAGSLGGVASQAAPESFAGVLREGLTRLSWCSSDPVCIESTASGTDALNLAACHACVLVPETSCELSNTFLDRALLFGTPEEGRESEGLFSGFISHG